MQCCPLSPKCIAGEVFKLCLFSEYSGCWKCCLVFTILLNWAYFIRTIFLQRRRHLRFHALLYKYVHSSTVPVSFFHTSLSFVIYSGSSRDRVHHVPILLQSEPWDKTVYQAVCIFICMTSSEADPTQAAQNWSGSSSEKDMAVSCRCGRGLWTMSDMNL